MGVPYLTKNTVVEYDEDRLIAWRHLGKHRWRYELEPVEGGTKVTETFDWSTARSRGHRAHGLPREAPGSHGEDPRTPRPATGEVPGH